MLTEQVLNELGLEAAEPEDLTVEQDRSSRDFIAFRIERAYMRIASQTERLLRDSCGLTLRQWWLICDIAAERPSTLKELCLMADIGLDIADRNLRILADFGYVDRWLDSADPRLIRIALTDEGDALYRRVVDVMEQRNLHLTKGMDVVEVGRLHGALQEVERAAMDDLSSLTPEENGVNAFGVGVVS